MINYDKLNEIMLKLGWTYGHLSRVARIGHGTVQRMKDQKYQPKRSNVIRKVVNVFELMGFEDASEILEDCPALTTEYAKRFNPDLALIKKSKRKENDRNQGIHKALKSKKTKGVRMLNQNVLDYFNLRADPFSAKIPLVREMYSNKRIEQVEAAVINAALENSFVLVQGECGQGKTTLMQRVEQKLKKMRKVKLATLNVVFIEDLTDKNIADAMIRDFGDRKAKQKLHARGEMIEDVASRNFKLKNKMVLIIDEAHRLQRSTLRSLKRLWESASRGAGGPSIMSIILFGQPYIQELLSEPHMAEVAQRLSVIELATLEDEDDEVKAVREYIEKKIQVVGGDVNILDPTAVEEVVRYAGTPLQVNNLMRNALVVAYETKEKRITREVIENA